VGAVIAPLVVPVIALTWGWQTAFVVTGLAGLTWVACWLPLYDSPERHARVTPGELAWIRSDPPESTIRVPWINLVPHRQTWAFACGKFLTDPICWFYHTWSGIFIAERFAVELKCIGQPLITI